MDVDDAGDEACRPMTRPSTSPRKKTAPSIHRGLHARIGCDCAVVEADAGFELYEFVAFGELVMDDAGGVGADAVFNRFAIYLHRLFLGISIDIDSSPTG